MTNSEPNKPRMCNDNCKGGGWCAFCNTLRSGFKLICSPFRAIWGAILRIPSGISTNWDTWREVIIVGGAMVAVLSIAGIAAYVFLYSTNRELPESLKNLLTLLTGYLFAYIPTSFAASSAEKSRKESDARLRDVLQEIRETSSQLADLRGQLNDIVEMFADATAEDDK